jgi:hypothetical protein
MDTQSAIAGKAITGLGWPPWVSGRRAARDDAVGLLGGVMTLRAAPA